MQEGRRFLVATIFSLGSLTLISRPGDIWYAVLEAFVAACLLGFVFLVLRSSGLVKAIGGTAGALALVVALSWLKATGRLAGLEAWPAAALAVSVVFVLARHILAMAWQSLRRGILNQHVLVEALSPGL